MNRIVVLLVSIVMLSSCSEAQVKSSGDKQQADQVINKVVTAKEFKAKMDVEGAQLIDIRTPEEYADGIIGEAVNMDFYNADFDAMIGSLDKSKPTLIYCHSGGRSGKAAKKMKAMGFKEVYDLKGGHSNWPYK